MPHWARGIRVRLVLAFLAMSAATLLAAILTLAPSLDHRLERDRLDDLGRLAKTSQLALRNLPEDTLQEGSRSVGRVVSELRRRTGGRVELYASDGEPLADTDPVGGTPERKAPPTVIGADLPRHGSVRRGVRGNEAIVVARVPREEGGRLTLVLRKPLGDTHAAADVVRRALPVTTEVGATVAVLLALLLGRGLARPLRRLRDDARALGEEGLGRPVTVGRPDEVGEVAGALEAMRVRLVAEEASRQDFLATASHELRTPLATLQGTLELLHEGLTGTSPVSAPAARAQAEAALRQTHRLSQLATDLLDLNRLDGQGPVTAEPVELRELADVAGEEFASRLGDRRLEVEGAPSLHGLGDPLSILRILRILLDNARVYGDGTVRVTLSVNGPHAVVHVDDEGPGIAEADRERLFERFERGPAATDKPGFGLGLPLARGLARRMGGELETLPHAPGARFELRLPRWHAPAETTPPPQPGRDERPDPLAVVNPGS